MCIRDRIIFVGPSGCGKSTTLRMIAGLEDISSGELWIDNCLMNMVEPKDRDLSMVFQNYALYPHMTVYENMAFGLRAHKTPKAEIDRRVREAASTLEISHLLDRKPSACLLYTSVYKGSSVRDSLDFIKFGDYKNQQEWAAVSQSLHDIIDTTVVKAAAPETLQGRTIEFTGTFTANKDDEILITPVKLTVN